MAAREDAKEEDVPIVMAVHLVASVAHLAVALAHHRLEAANTLRVKMTVASETTTVVTEVTVTRDAAAEARTMVCASAR